jgi:cytoskeletal protein CcmA (bactofilin family)
MNGDHMDKSKQLVKQTLVEEGTELKGTLKSSCQVVVNGTIDGQIEAPSLTITETGTVLGSVKAQKLRSEGTLAGDIDADDVYLAGTVGSNTVIRAKRLEVKLAPERGKLAVTFGECIMDVGEDPAIVKEPLPEPAKAAPVAPALPEEPAPVAAEGGRSPAAVEEPSWSEPPPGQRKSADRRDSQAPPA